MSIPKAIKQLVWNKYIGQDHGKGICQCCELTSITQMDFQCGHIRSKFNGGEETLLNLIPLCSLCNSSMGTMNMDEFCKKHGLKFKLPQDTLTTETSNSKEQANSEEVNNSKINQTNNTITKVILKDSKQTSLGDPNQLDEMQKIIRERLVRKFLEELNILKLKQLCMTLFVRFPNGNNKDRHYISPGGKKEKIINKIIKNQISFNEIKKLIDNNKTKPIFVKCYNCKPKEGKYFRSLSCINDADDEKCPECGVKVNRSQLYPNQFF